MIDLIRWLWWQARRVNPDLVCLITFVASFAVGGYWLIQQLAERPPFRCDVIQRSIDAHEECVRREGCIYEQADVYHYYRNLSLKETYCQGGE